MKKRMIAIMAAAAVIGVMFMPSVSVPASDMQKIDIENAR